MTVAGPLPGRASRSDVPKGGIPGITAGSDEGPVLMAPA